MDSSSVKRKPAAGSLAMSIVRLCYCIRGVKSRFNLIKKILVT